MAIEAATVAGDVNALRTVFGDSPDFPNVRDECGQTCLDHAIWSGPLSLIRALLDLRADPNYSDPAGSPSLFTAIDRTTPDRHDVLALLLSARADVTSVDSTITPRSTTPPVAMTPLRWRCS